MTAVLQRTYMRLWNAEGRVSQDSPPAHIVAMRILPLELEHLVAQTTQGRQSDFDTHSRIIETRYKEDDNQRGS